MRHAMLPLLLGTLLVGGLTVAYLFLRSAPSVTLEQGAAASGAASGPAWREQEAAMVPEQAAERPEASVQRTIEEPEGGDPRPPLP